MGQQAIGAEIDRIIQLLARLPGLGPRSARRAALHLIRKREELMQPLAQALEEAYSKILICAQCGNVDTCQPCTICQDPRRDGSLLIIVETIADLWALERLQTLQGRYHVLGGTLSAMDGIGPQELNFPTLLQRVASEEVVEIILAVNATVEGQTTAHYLSDLLTPFQVKITRLAQGLPIGGELDYLDEGTLSTAIRQRSVL